MLNKSLGAWLIAVLSCAVLSGCATPQLDFSVDASRAINLDETGDAYAVVVRVYQLTDPVLFERSEFDDMWKADEQILADTLVSLHEITVEPSLSRTVSIEKAERARYAGVVAYFRNDEGHWRAHKKVNHGFIRASTNMTLKLDGNRVELEYR